VSYPSLEPANTNNVFVKNISSKVSTEMLADFFSYCGAVSKISVYKFE
jgi:RNA recognition motif-containing protein